MDIQTAVTMDQEAADKAFREYRAAWLADRNRIDAELMRGYKALSEGRTLVSLREAIQTAGVDAYGRPNLAIARADEQQIQMDRERDGSIRYTPDAWSRVASTDRVFEMPVETLPAITEAQEAARTPDGLSRSMAPWTERWTASLPFIPPQYRPPHGLVNYHLLWEAEWRRARGSQRRDPILLKRIGGDLFAVVAAWDLTALEKLVLAR